MCDATIGPDVSSAASLAPWLTNWFETLSVRENTADAKHNGEHGEHGEHGEQERKPPHDPAAAEATSTGDGCSVRGTRKRKHWSSQVGTVYSRSRSPPPSLRVRKRQKRAVSWATDTKLDLLFHASGQVTDEVIALDDVIAAIAMWLALHHRDISDTVDTVDPNNSTRSLRQILQLRLCNRMLQGRWDMVHFLAPLGATAEVNPPHRVCIKYVHLQVKSPEVRDVECGAQVHVALSVQGVLDSSSSSSAVSHPKILATRGFEVTVGA